MWRGSSLGIYPTRLPFGTRTNVRRASIQWSTTHPPSICGNEGRILDRVLVQPQAKSSIRKGMREFGNPMYGNGHVWPRLALSEIRDFRVPGAEDGDLINGGLPLRYDMHGGFETPLQRVGGGGGFPWCGIRECVRFVRGRPFWTENQGSVGPSAPT